MKICEKCGNELNDNNKFCVKCGTPVSDSGEKQKPVENDVPKKPKQEKQVKPKKEIDEKTAKKRKQLAIIALVVVVAFFTVYKIGESVTSRDKVVEKFITAITEKDTAVLATLIKSSDPRMEITEDNIKPLIDYLDENPSYFDQLIQSIEEDDMKEVDNLRKNDYPVFSKEDDNSDMISIRKKGKKLLFYDNYEFVMQPFFVRISTNYEDAVVYMNDKELGKSDSDNFIKEFGPFTPGKYTFKSVYEGEYATIESKEEVYLITDFYSPNTKVENVDLYLNGTYVYIDTNYYDGQIIIDGKNTGLTAEEVNKKGIGPVDESTKVQLSREFPWGTILSEEVIVGDSGTYLGMYIDPKNEDVQTAVMEAVNTFLHDDTAAFNARNVEKYTNLLDPELNRRRETIEYNITYERHEIIEMVNSIYDLDSFKVYLNDGEYHAEINGVYNYKGGYYYEGDEVPELTEKTNRWGYDLRYDEKNDKWLIYNMGYIYSFKDSNTKEFTFKK